MLPPIVKTQPSSEFDDGRKGPLRSLRLLESFAKELMDIHSTPKLLWAVAEKVISQLGWEDCVIYMLDEHRQVLIQVAAYGPKNIDYEAICEPIEIPLDKGIVGKVARTHQPVLITDTRKHPEYIEDDRRRLSELAVPIKIGGRLLGVIDSEHSDVGFYGEEERLILETIASITATKIEKARTSKDSEELALFYKRNPNPVMQIDANRIINIMNSAASDCFQNKFSKGDEINRPGLEEALEKALESGNSRWECSILDTKSGNVRVGEFRIVHLPTGDFNLYGNEITHIIQLKKSAEAANEAKSKFLSVMSHEIRTPLNAVLGLTDLLIHDNPSREEQLRHLAYMEFSGRHLLSLVNDILDLEKLASGKAKSINTAFALSDLIHSIIESFRNRTDKTGIELKLSLDHELPVRIETDIKWLTQILNNLLSNAIKYTEQGTVELAVDCTQMDNGREGLRFQVRDTGQGIPKSEQMRILQPFEQIRSNPSIEGTGLGLAIVNSLIQKMEGSISIDSMPGEGSTFTVVIPLNNIPESRAQDRKPSAQGANDITTNGAAKRPEEHTVLPKESTGEHPNNGQAYPILLADDNELNRFVACKLLERWGYTVVEALDGEAAVEAWKKMKPCIILMDVQMPNMDGVEATQKIRDLELGLPGLPKSPIIALTADAEEKTLLRVLAAGMDDRIIKPFDPPTLQALLVQYTKRLMRISGMHT